MNILRLSVERVPRTRLSSSVKARSSTTCSTFSEAGTQSFNSSSTSGTCPQPRFSALYCSHLLSDRCRVIVPRKAANLPGRWGGIVLQALKNVSFTHSSLSSWLCRILNAIEWQYLPYFFAVSDIAVSARAQYKRLKALTAEKQRLLQAILTNIIRTRSDGNTREKYLLSAVFPSPHTRKKFPTIHGGVSDSLPGRIETPLFHAICYALRSKKCCGKRWQ